MRRFFAILAALALTLSLAACGNQGGASSGESASDRVEGDLETLLGQVTQDVTDPEMSLLTTEVTDETFSWFFFIDPIDEAQALVSEPAIGSIAHFVGLLRVPEGTDPEQVRTQIEEKADPRKWVCVEAEKTAVIRRGDLILLAMSSAESVDKAVENFNALP